MAKIWPNFKVGEMGRWWENRAVARQNLNFSKTAQNLSYDTNLKNIDQMWNFGETIIKIGLFLTKLWLFEVWRYDVIYRADVFLFAPVEPATSPENRKFWYVNWYCSEEVTCQKWTSYLNIFEGPYIYHKKLVTPSVDDITFSRWPHWFLATVNG